MLTSAMTCFTLFVVTLAAGATDASWFADQGGRCTLDAAGRVVGVDLSATWITDVDLARLGALEHLQELDLSHTRITSVGLERLAQLPQVRTLNLHYAEFVTDSGLGHLTAWRHLEHLDLQGTKITSRALEHISQLTNLRSLDVSFTEIDDDGFQHLSSLLKLQRLAIGGNRLSGSCLTFLDLLPSLVELDVGGMQRVDSGFWGLPLNANNLRQLGTLTQLRVLRLNGANLNDRGADRPGSPRAVRSELSDLSALQGLINLEVIDLSCTPVDARSLEPLTALPKLREVRLGMAQNIDDRAVAVLKRMKGLATVYVEGTQITDQKIVKDRPGLNTEH